jgi:hypothetical protein
MQDFVDYIDFIQPGLKEQIRNLSAILRQIIDDQLPPQKLVLETLTPNPLPQLRNMPLEELFRFDTDIIDSYQASAVASPSPDQGCADQQLFYAQGAIKLGQDIRPEYTSGSLQRQSPSTEIKDGNPSHSTPDCSKYIHLSVCHEQSDYHQKPTQQLSRYMENISYFQDVDRSAQVQPDYNREFPNPQDYYVQDVDWRAQPPSSDCEGESPGSQDNDLQRSDPSEAESSDFNSWINYSPQSTPGIVSASSGQSPGRNLPAYFVDMPRASTLL